MATEELAQVNVFGDTKPVIQINPNWRDDFADYQAGYEAAPDKLEYNKQMLGNMREHYKR